MLSSNIKSILLFLFLFQTTIFVYGQEMQKTFILAGSEIHLTYESINAEIQIEIDKKIKGVEVATITLNSKNKISPKALSFKWATPSNNVAGYWSTGASLDKTITPSWGPAKVKSMLARESPVICLFGHDDINRQTFAVSEVLNTVITSTAVKEENGMIYNEFQLFTEKHKDLSTYQVQIRLDTRPISYARTLEEVAAWWASFDRYKPALVPEAAKLPVYSSWYSYHQNVTKEALIEEQQLPI